MTAIVWLTKDLRLADHPALAGAQQDYGRVLPVFVLDERDPWLYGGASAWWLHHSLAQLRDAIKARGGQLVLRRGAVTEVLPALMDEARVEALYFSRAYEPWWVQQQYALYQHCRNTGLVCRRFAGRLLFEPDRIVTQQNKPFQVFTPFYNHCRKQYAPASPLPQTEAIDYAHQRFASDRLEDWQLLPKAPNWASQWPTIWRPGWRGALEQLREAVTARVDDYGERRDWPGTEGTSRLSPHLATGELSPRQIWHAVSEHCDAEQREPFLRQLVWRDFSYYLLHHWPHIPDKPFKPAFKHFAWRRSKRDLRAWQRGQTGYPIVDAGMRELWQTGWMHNRVRMIVASFLCKHLRIHWLHGAQWFWDTLVDADLANNTQGWQWVAGCGADAAPYFRIFNPILQGEKFDPQGDYVRRWVPELQALPDRHLHAPWRAPRTILQQCGITLGQTYPEPIVDHRRAREHALAAYEPVKTANQ